MTTSLAFWSTQRAAARRAVGSDCDTLCLDDPHFDFGTDIGVQADRHPIDAERTNRLVQVNLPLLDHIPLSFELVRDVAGRDGSKELAFLADARGERQRYLAQL